MTAIMMASMGSAAFTAATLDTTVTVGTSQWFDFGTEDTFYAFGYNDITADPQGLDTVGSITVDNYVDGSAISRTVSGIYYTEDTFGVADPDDDSIYFGLIGTSVPNTDVTFREIEYNGITYTRASADVYSPSVGAANTYWQWYAVSPNGPTSGVRVFKVII